MKRYKFAKKLLIIAGFAILLATNAKAQYFQSLPEHAQHIVVKASGYDSVIVDRSTPFELPKTNDTIPFIYHEPMPDSIMPRSAIVIGTITLQFEYAEDLVPALEKYARKAGADWIVSFQEPRSVLTKDHWKVYRSTALLLHVLDPNFIHQSQVSYSYYEESKLTNYAAVSGWFDTYGKHMGFKGDDNNEEDNK
jgi:hypothetical protein